MNEEEFIVRRNAGMLEGRDGTNFRYLRVSEQGVQHWESKKEDATRFSLLEDACEHCELPPHGFVSGSKAIPFSEG